MAPPPNATAPIWAFACPTAYIESPNNLPSRTAVIEPPGAVSISLTFSFLFLEESHDWLTVYSCTTVSPASPLGCAPGGLTLLANLTGYYTPAEAAAAAVMAPAGALILHWQSDLWNPHSGFSATWVAGASAPVCLCAFVLLC